MPSVLCLNDQGGSVMNCSENISGTLRAQERGHQPLVFDNHGQDSRFRGPVQTAQTVSSWEETTLLLSSRRQMPSALQAIRSTGSRRTAATVLAVRMTWRIL